MMLVRHVRVGCQFLVGGRGFFSTCNTTFWSGIQSSQSLKYSTSCPINEDLIDKSHTEDSLKAASQPRCDSESKDKQVGLTMKSQRKLLKQQPVPSPDHRLLKVAIIGAPNAGKSTLLNKLVGWKVAPVSQRVHTTREKTLAVLSEDEKQIVFLDTPGIIVPGKMKRHNLEMSLLVDPHAALTEADLVVVLVDVSHVWHRSRLDPEILKLLHLHADLASVLVLNKVDLIQPKHRLLNVVRKLTQGIVDDHKDWSTIKSRNKRVDLQELFSKTSISSGVGRKNCEDRMSNEVFDVKEVCNRMQDYDNSDDRILNADDDRSVSSDKYIDLIKLEKSMIGKAKTDKMDKTEDDDDLRLSDSERESDNREMQSRKVDGAGPGFVGDLHSPDVWKDYYRRLQEIGRRIENEEGWSHFDSVFMISALDGDGISDLKQYLLDRTFQSPWLYSSSLVTDQNPVKLATMIIRERLLDHLPDEIPYCVQVKLSLWEIGDDGLLRAAFDIVCNDRRHMHRILGKDGETVRQIAAEAKQELMNVFRREMTLKLVVQASRSLNIRVATAAKKSNSKKSTSDAVRKSVPKLPDDSL